MEDAMEAYLQSLNQAILENYGICALGLAGYLLWWLRTIEQRVKEVAGKVDEHRQQTAEEAEEIRHDMELIEERIMNDDSDEE
jgi:hypothetical protein